MLRIGFVITSATIFVLSAVYVHSDGISDGWLAGRRQFKHHALIGCVLDDGSEHWLCNGAIITNRFVAAPASCVQDCDNIQIRVGSTVHPAMNVTDEYSAVYSTKSGINPYYAPGYVWGSLEHDLALLETNTEIIFNRFVREVLFPKFTYNTVAADVPAMATGFGEKNRSNHWWELQYLRFKVLDYKECLKFFPDMTNNSICANSTDYQDRQLRGSLCNEFGSPLVLKNDNRTLIGIYQKSREICDEGGPELFLNTGAYLGWIWKTANISSFKH